MEIHQLLPNLTYGDAISNHALALQGLLRSWGHKSEIYVQYIHPGVVGKCRDYREYNPTKKTVTIYHHSIGSEVSKLFKRIPGKRMMIYHNITPHHFFAPYNEKTYRLTKQGREALGEYREVVDMTIGVSAYNCEELAAIGYRNPQVLPILVDFTDFERTEPSPLVMGQFDDDWTNLLFVGRIAPNKRQEDVIRAFARYNRFINRRSRLFIVGGYTEMERYLGDLKDVVRSLDLEDYVHFPGHISFADLVAYYKLADLFLCMSEHEGFCVPLLEAMYHDLPILAYASTGIPYTMGDSGVLVTEKDYPVVAEMIHLLLSDPVLRERVIRRQRQRLGDFSAEPIAKQFKAQIEELLAS